MSEKPQTNLYQAAQNTQDIADIVDKKRRRKKRRKILLLVLLTLLLGFGIFLCTKTGALWLHLLKIRTDYRISTTGLCDQTAAQIEVTDGFVINIAEFGGEKRATDSRSVLYLVSFGYREHGIWHFSQVGDASAGKRYGDHAGNAPQFSVPFVLKLGDYTVISCPIEDGSTTLDSTCDNIGTMPVLITNAFSNESAENAAWLTIIYGLQENDPPVMTGRTDFSCGMGVFVIEDMPDNYVFTYDEGVLTAEDIYNLVGQ